MDLFPEPLDVLAGLHDAPRLTLLGRERLLVTLGSIVESGLVSAKTPLGAACRLQGSFRRA